MKGDFSRLTFQPAKRYSRVMMQQGRVQLDADWNEQSDILTHYLRSLAADLIGPHGGPKDHCGFSVGLVVDGGNLRDLTLSRGHYYVDGILCQVNTDDARYNQQEDYPLKEGAPFPANPFLVYLDVWERFITYLDDDEIREVALGGPDTAGRLKIVCQVRTGALNSGARFDNIKPAWNALVEGWQPKNRGLLQARAKQPSPADLTEPCPVSPDLRDRGPENQLYRVEVHAGGKVGEVTFKWSRENGSVVFPIARLETAAAITTVELAAIWRDQRLGLAVGDVVEITDDYKILHGEAGDLLTVYAIDLDELRVSLNGTASLSDVPDRDLHPILRRWDHLSGGPGNALPIVSDTWIDLEAGVQIKFVSAPAGEQPHIYRSHDYWQIPARTATGDVEWPGPVDSPVALPPHGIQHHYAPLAVISLPAGGSFQATSAEKVYEALAK